MRFADYPSFIGPVGSAQELRIRRDGVHLSDRGKVEVAAWITSQVLSVP